MAKKWHMLRCRMAYNAWPTEEVAMLSACFQQRTMVHVRWCVGVGPAEQSMEEEWQKLQEHPDILATAPDDEVLGEMLAIQVNM